MTAPSRRERRAARAALDAQPATRGRGLVVGIILAVCAVAAIAQFAVAGSSRSTAATLPVSAIPAGDEIDVEWFCADGTSSPNGRADETVIIGNIGTTDADATVIVHSAGTEKTRGVTVPVGGQLRVRVADIAAVAEPGVTVHARGGRVVVEHLLAGNGDQALGPCARRPASEWYFAAGSTVKGAFEWLALYNPFAEGAIVDIDVFTREMNGDVPVERPVERITSVNVPGRTRTTVGVHERIGRYAATALAVRARSGRIVAERSLVFDDVEGKKGLAVSLGLTEPSTSFVFPEGRISSGRTEVLALANPTNATVQVTVDSLFEGGITLEPATVTVNAKSVVDYPIPSAPQDLARVTRLSSTGPIVAEMRTATAKPQAGVGIATVMGERRPASFWSFAAARLNATGTNRYRVFNPAARAAAVRIRIAGVADEAGPEVEVPPGSAVTIDMKGTPATPAALLVLQSDEPVFAARVSEGSGITVSPGMPAA